MLGGDDQQVVRAGSAHVHAGRVERLGIHLAIDRAGPELAKLSRVDRRGRQQRLVTVPAGAHVIAVVGVDPARAQLSGVQTDVAPEKGEGEEGQQEAEADRGTTHAFFPPRVA